MRSRLEERLRKLEKAFPMNPVVEPCRAPVAELAAKLAARGFVRGPNESLAETLARALGISCQELRSRLMVRVRAAQMAARAGHIRSADHTARASSPWWQTST